MDLTWSLHYCLACDRQTSGGAYCSQSCRLAETENASRSAFTGLSSSMTAVEEAEAGNADISSAGSGSGFHLLPAINFATYRGSSSTTTTTTTTSTDLGSISPNPNGPYQQSSALYPPPPPPSTLATAAAPQPYPPSTNTHTHFSQYYTAQPSTKGLSASSSRSSLSSNASTSSSSSSSSTQQIHDQISSELRAYANSFDTTRHWRRRRTWS